jgi:hypothetical protein
VVIKAMGKTGVWCTCDECGKLFHRPMSHMRKYNDFCSPYCWIVWNGREYEWNSARMMKEITIFWKLHGWSYNLTKPSK